MDITAISHLSTAFNLPHRTKHAISGHDAAAAALLIGSPASYSTFSLDPRLHVSLPVPHGCLPHGWTTSRVLRDVSVVRFGSCANLNLPIRTENYVEIG